jgi:hypothetical protein
VAGRLRAEGVDRRRRGQDRRAREESGELARSWKSSSGIAVPGGVAGAGGGCGRRRWRQHSRQDRRSPPPDSVVARDPERPQIGFGQIEQAHDAASVSTMSVCCASSSYVRTAGRRLANR